VSCNRAKPLVGALGAIARDEVARSRVGRDPAKDDAAEEGRATEPVGAVDAAGDLTRCKQARLVDTRGQRKVASAAWEEAERGRGKRGGEATRTIGFWSLPRTRDWGSISRPPIVSDSGQEEAGRAARGVSGASGKSEGGGGGSRATHNEGRASCGRRGRCRRA